ncbi:LysR substrate-binding domain-containing protein [Psychrobacter sp. FDAARGOS_221]|uniref:LysR substrate-binding domain-containing protein n=1 Tax=Psychrobacter sp. FDAARGOS_221 TaxID=1975705 RepID=UPI000BB53C32|nr:LysR substrate-binding domain-containing protein [Psychrobacter sp. FDAARGOS_221]PNK59708.1 LysR family transcriptional regulator [Psychrobacter sp. FDAARGOS_221]
MPKLNAQQSNTLSSLTSTSLSAGLTGQGLLPKITLKQLAIFVSIYQTGSTSAASEQLHLSQSAVSSALSELEERLTMPLFERIGRRLHKNENAHAIYTQAQAILGQCSALEQYHSYQAGRIHLGASTTIGNNVMPSLIQQLYTQMPDAQVTAFIGNTQDVVDQVEQLTVDLGLVEGKPRATDTKVIEQRAWRTDKLVVFAKKDSQWLAGMQPTLIQNQTDNADSQHYVYQVTPEQLSGLPLLVREPGSGTRQVIDEQLLQFIPQANVMMAVQQSEAVRNMVKADIGIGCLSQYVIDSELKQGSLVAIEVEGIDLQRVWWAIWHKDSFKSKLWQHFATQLGI